MIEYIKEIIIDQQIFNFYNQTPRELKLHSIAKKANIIMGVRRCGKSTYLFQVIQALLAKGVSKNNILYLNFIDDRIPVHENKILNQIWETYHALNLKKNDGKVYYFFDEIQVIPEWETFVERLLRTELCEVHITGSSAKMLSKEIATQMRGRALSWELFPFSFREFLLHQQIEIQSNLSTKQRLEIQNSFEKFFTQGSFPEVIDQSKKNRIKIHQEYFNSILYRDIIDRYDIKHPKVIRELALWACNNNGSLYSLNRLYGHLKALGYNLSKDLVGQYLDRFEEAYLFFTVRLYNASIAKVNSNPKKIYCIDHGLVNSIASGMLSNNGHILENLVYIALRQQSESIWYYKTNNDLEVDFISEYADKKHLIQVCMDLNDPETYKRETKALNQAMYEQKIKEGYIITWNQDETISVDHGTIQVMSAWRFLLHLQGT